MSASKPSPDRIVLLNDACVAKGGATGLALALARGLAGRGHRVTFLCGDDGGPSNLPGVDVVHLGASRLMEARAGAAFRQGIWNRAARDMVAGWIADHDTPATIYHLHGWAQILSPAVFSALAPVASRVVTHAHDMFLACPNGVYTDFRTGTVCRRVPLGAACLTTPCDKRSRLHKTWRVARQTALRRARSGRPWGPVAMIHPAMAEPLARGGLDRADLRTLRNPAAPWTTSRIRAEQNRAIAFVGRIEPDKGAVALAEAADAAGLPMIMVGDGTARAGLAARFPSITFTGWTAPTEIGPAVAGARALVMPSLLPEPFGLVAAEASASGLPVVLSDAAFMADEIAAHGLGLVYPFATPGALTEALHRLAALPDEDVADISARAYASQHPLALAPDQWLDETLALYAETLS